MTSFWRVDVSGEREIKIRQVLRGGERLGGAEEKSASCIVRRARGRREVYNYRGRRGRKFGDFHWTAKTLVARK